jgi:hypothetical protein
MISKSLTSSLLVLALAASTSAFAGTMAKPADTTKAAETKTTETTTETKADAKAEAPAKKKVHKKVTKKTEVKKEEKKDEAKPASTR